MYCKQRNRRQPFGQAKRHRPRHRHRRHRARQRERRHHHRLPPPRQPHRPVQHRIVMLQRADRVDVGVHARLRAELVLAQPAGDAGHLHHVLDPLGPQRIGVHDLVGQCQLLVQAIEVPDRGVDVDRLDWVAPCHMDAVEILRQLHEFLERLEVARPLAALQIPGIRRGRDVDEDHVLAAQRDLARGVAGRDRELLGDGLEHLHHEGLVHPDVRALDLAACLLQDRHRFGVQELDPDLRQDPHRPAMDRHDSVHVQRLGRTVGIDGNAPGHLVDRGGSGAALVARPAPGAAAAACILVHRGTPWFAGRNPCGVD